MKFSKIVSIAVALPVLALSVLPAASASALSAADMYLSGSSNSNGAFSVTVYEDTHSDTVTGASVELSFSQAVSGVSYDYSVGPFTAVTPSGAHNAYGTVTGANPVARVSFTLANPGTVTATVAASSYLKHAEGTTVESFAINRGSADFTYTAPASTGTMGGGNTSGGSSSTPTNTATAASRATNSTSAATNTQAVAGDQTQATSTTPATDAAKDDTAKPKAAQTAGAAQTAHKSSLTWLWIVIIAGAAAIAYAVYRRRTPAATEAESVSVAAAATETPAKAKPAPHNDKAPAKKKTGRGQHARRTK